jgi:tetratricopeptide (TPR) repeat protein
MKHFYRLTKCITILLLVCIYASCAIEKPVPCYRNGVAYGISDGLFRGKWWNYYQVGLSFTDGGCWQEACNAFESAIQLRYNDSKWASTYGVRHIHYYPHRESGIAFYYMGQYQKAFKSLNQSITDDPTGRAIHYLNLTKKAQTIRDNKDKHPPKITISSPLKKNTNDYAVLVSGMVKDDSYIEKIIINNQPIEIKEFKPEIAFEKSLTIHSGTNPIIIESIDVMGNKSKISTDVFLDIQSPAYSMESIDSIALNGLHLKGSFFDNVGLQRCFIQSQQNILFSQDIHGEPYFYLDQKISNILNQTDLRITASDISGNEIHIDIPQTSKTLRSFNENSFTFGHLTQRHQLIKSYLLASSNIQGPIFYANNADSPQEDIVIDIKGYTKKQVIYFDELVLKINVSGVDILKSVMIYLNGERISTTASYANVHSLGTNYCLTMNLNFIDGENILKVVADNGELHEQSFVFHKKELDLDDSNMTVSMIPSPNTKYDEGIELIFLSALKKTERFNLLTMKTIEEAAQAYKDRSKSLIDYIDEGEIQPPLWALEWHFEARKSSKPVRMTQEKSKIEINVNNIGEFSYEGDLANEVQMLTIHYFDIVAKLIDLDDKNVILDTFESYDENQDYHLLCRQISQLVSKQFIDKFPKVTGTIKTLIKSKNKIYIMPGKNKGVKKGMRVVIFRTTPIIDELTDEIIDQDIEIVEEAIVRKVKKKGFFAILQNKKNIDKVLPLDRVMTR